MLQYSLAAINSPNDTVGCSLKLLCAPSAAASASLFWRPIQAQLRLTESLPRCFWDARLPPGRPEAARPPRRGAGLRCVASPLRPNLRPRVPCPPLAGHEPAKGFSGRTRSKHSEPSAALRLLPAPFLPPAARRQHSHATKAAASKIISSLI